MVSAFSRDDLLGFPEPEKPTPQTIPESTNDPVQQNKPRELSGPTLNSTEKAEFIVQEEALVITKWEADFAERLVELIPTPRAAKRLSNTYRILKARVRG